MAKASAGLDTESRLNLDKHRKSAFKRFFMQIDIQLMVLPALVFIFIFSYIPMYGVLIAFQDYKMGSNLLNNNWVGFKHFVAFFNAPEFYPVMRNTIVISFLKFIFGFPAPILLALMLNEVRKMFFKRVVQTVTYLPHFLSWVVIGSMVTSLLSVDNGSVNMLLEKLKLIDEPVNFLSMSEYFWTILVTTNVWKEIGFASIVYLAAIAGIDPHLYEAASIDGASRFKQMWLITLPCIMPVVIIFMILAIGNLTSAGFEDILILASNPALREVSDSLDVYVVRVGIDNYRYSYATAIGLFKAVVSVTLLTFANFIARKTGNSLW
ncbi:ABC transporter permease subunit [Paenibacillus thiaminolyticus]|uniref:ABC transporter permease subunit n=1 Tax=Paenibacillus thiaminolyticus TaxID=49283 RepID=A0AAJ1G8E3_PANTH|nr:ABC transporter permease subunit [Paenibacillus thiaminolyticus]MCY9536480.1 ABC transporter permease subunit [Paenibacillus thiaminolyticus]MCY9601492.1 ABC transporter permease subunit [Paenibacillus thiaminolyticus]MCY9610240.1 ABC transporter permease subunit [Paenibacillus thiaminolyticus]MCY9616520.1 ABC transporter permease subunit [Paenibacillus thiaminolyticus]MCY9616868.1 ABC transporter permease subunit [Paenibacillus thiaminolyticus]